MSQTFPIYIISKGRWDSRLTVKSLEQVQLPYRIVVEPQEKESYARFIKWDKILVLPFSNLGQGSIPARNWVWEHSIEEKSERHWILDDNIDGFFTWGKKKSRTRTMDGRCFFHIEEFVNRYSNIALAGMQYDSLGIYGGPAQRPSGPVIFNTRIYSCILILNKIPYRWRGRYNEDTDLSLRVLKDGWVTALFNAFRCGKKATMTMKGGNMDELYKNNGRALMALSLWRQHPDVVKIKRRFGRWQHVVNYEPFKFNGLKTA